MKGVSRLDSSGRWGARLSGVRVDNISLSSVRLDLDRCLLVLVHLVVLILLEVLIVLRIVVVRDGILLSSLGKVDDLATSATADDVVQRDDIVIIVDTLLLLFSCAV